MQVKNRLATIRICVDHDTIPIFGKTLFSSDLGRCEEEMAELITMRV